MCSVYLVYIIDFLYFAHMNVKVILNTNIEEYVYLFYEPNTCIKFITIYVGKSMDLIVVFGRRTRGPWYLPIIEYPF
jgi:hypothetical protein